MDFIEGAIILVIGFLLLMFEALLIWWIGPNTGIEYFKDASYGNILTLVLIGNAITGGTTALNTRN